MILIEADGITKSFGPEPLLAGACFELRRGDKVGLVGPNGSGKSTLLKICAGHIELDTGNIRIPRELRIGYLEQQPTWNPARTVWEEVSTALADVAELAAHSETIAQKIAQADDPQQRARLSKQFDHLHHELHVRGGYSLDHHVSRVLMGLGFAQGEFAQPLGQLSGGQQSRALLGKLLLSRADVLLLDEPSNHLDLDATAWLEGFLAESPQAMILVSHDRYLLDKVTDRTLELYHGTIESYRGNFSAYWHQKQERAEVERRTFERQQAEVARTQEFIRRNQAGQKSIQAKDRVKKLARMQLVTRPREIPVPPMGFTCSGRAGDIVLKVERISKAYGRPLFHDLSFEIVRGQRWGIIGPNGSGKTTLLRCILGQETLDHGRIIVGAGVQIAYFDQQLRVVDESQQLVDAIRPHGKEFNLQQRRDLLARFGFFGEDVHKPVAALSGGERNRAALALASASDANFLIFDEPTNHLDLWARGGLEHSLRQFEGSVLLVTHDRYFLNRVVDRLLVVEPAGVQLVYGGYDTYATRRSEPVPAAADGKAKASPASPTAGKGNKRRFPYRKLEDLEAEIAEREEALIALQHGLASPELHRDGARVKAVKQELLDQQQALQGLYDHWEEAMERN